jgi:hypothetical protein
MKLADLVFLKESTSEDLQDLKDRLEQLYRDMEQEAEPEGGPIANQYADEIEELEREIKRLSPKQTPMTYDQAIGRVPMNESEDTWNAIDVSRKAEKEISNSEWNSRTTKKLDILKALNKAGKFKKEWNDETLQGWVDQNYSWEKLARQFKNINEMKATNNKKLLTERFQELAGIKPLYQEDKGDSPMPSRTRVSVPRFVKDKNNPNFLNVYIDYDLGPGGSSIALGKETMTGQIRRESAAEAMKLAGDVARDLKAKYNLEDIEISDLENGKVRVFAVSDDFIDMQVNEGSCGYSQEAPDGKELDTPGGMKSMPADTRTMTMMREAIRKELKKLHEQGFDDRLKAAGGFSDEEFDDITSRDIGSSFPGPSTDVGNGVIQAQELIKTLKNNYKNMSDKELDAFSVEMTKHFLDINKK